MSYDNGCKDDMQWARVTFMGLGILRIWIIILDWIFVVVQSKDRDEHDDCKDIYRTNYDAIGEMLHAAVYIVFLCNRLHCEITNTILSITATCMSLSFWDRIDGWTDRSIDRSIDKSIVPINTIIVWISNMMSNKTRQVNDVVGWHARLRIKSPMFDCEWGSFKHQCISNQHYRL